MRRPGARALEGAGPTARVVEGQQCLGEGGLRRAQHRADLLPAPRTPSRSARAGQAAIARLTSLTSSAPPPSSARLRARLRRSSRISPPCRRCLPPVAAVSIEFFCPRRVHPGAASVECRLAGVSGTPHLIASSPTAHCAMYMCLTCEPRGSTSTLFRKSFRAFFGLPMSASSALQAHTISVAVCTPRGGGSRPGVGRWRGGQTETGACAPVSVEKPRGFGLNLQRRLIARARFIHPEL